MVLFVDPREERFVLVVEDAAANVPVLVAAGVSQHAETTPQIIYM